MRTPWAFLHHWLFEEPPVLTDEEVERADTVAGLRALADLLERCPDAQVPSYVTVHHSVYDWERGVGRMKLDIEQQIDRCDDGAPGGSGPWPPKPGGEVRHLGAPFEPMRPRGLYARYWERLPRRRFKRTRMLAVTRKLQRKAKRAAHS